MGKQEELEKTIWMRTYVKTLQTRENPVESADRAVRRFKEAFTDGGTLIDSSEHKDF